MFSQELATIIRDSGMSTRHEYYSGRGANGDVNEKHIDKIYDGILAKFGKEAAQSFVLMVRDIKMLSATDFLLSLDALEMAGWSNVAPSDRKSIAPDLSDPCIAFATVASVMSEPRDRTSELRGNFLRRHKMQAPKTDIRHIFDKYGMR